MYEFIRSAWCAGLVAVSATAVVAGQGPPPPGPAKPLSLQQVIDEALTRNPDLLALEREYERARLEPATAGGLEPPMFETEIWRWPINTLNPGNADMYMFSVGQSLPGRGKRASLAAVAEADASIAGASIAVRARRIVDEVKGAWADLYLIRKAVEIQQGTVGLLRQFTDIASTKYSTGRVSQQDVLAGIVELSRLQDRLIRLNEDERLVAARLNALLNRPPQTRFGPLADPADLSVLPAPADLQQLALGHEPTLRVAALEVDRARAGLAASLAAYKPDFKISGGYMLMPNSTDAWMARATISWPGAPWSRGRLDARQAVAAAEISTREARRLAAENDVRLAVHAAWVRADGAGERVVLLVSSILPQARQALAVAQSAYESDRGSFLALIDSQRVLLDIELDYHRARAERAQALSDLERAVGVELTLADTFNLVTGGGRQP